MIARSLMLGLVILVAASACTREVPSEDCDAALAEIEMRVLRSMTLETLARQAVALAKAREQIEARLSMMLMAAAYPADSERRAEIEARAAIHQRAAVEFEAEAAEHEAAATCLKAAMSADSPTAEVP